MIYKCFIYILFIFYLFNQFIFIMCLFFHSWCISIFNFVRVYKKEKLYFRYNMWCSKCDKKRIVDYYPGYPG